MSTTEIQQRADFTRVRYAQCWEDSRLLRLGLHPAGRRCLSIGSAGDNSMALLAAGAQRVTVVEMNPAQVACVKLRQAAYQRLDHRELLELMGSRPSQRRLDWYRACRDLLDGTTRGFWDARERDVEAGIAGAGKFERYFRVFRTLVLPWAHTRREVLSLLTKRENGSRSDFYEAVWNNRRWRWIFHGFFSRTVMGALGRDPEFFRYVEGSVAARILQRVRHALVELDPSENPYLHWILTGTHGEALPEALEEGNFDPIRRALTDGRMEVFSGPLEALLSGGSACYDAFNLSDIFEYMGEAPAAALLERIAGASAPGARLAYWNMLAPRSRPPEMAGTLLSLDDEAERLFAGDRAFFYSRFVLEEVAR